jgi:hypothetical protein
MALGVDTSVLQQAQANAIAAMQEGINLAAQSAEHKAKKDLMGDVKSGIQSS